MFSSGPIVLKITGSKISPCETPNKTNAKNAIKTVLKISDVEKASGNVPRTVMLLFCHTMQEKVCRNSLLLQL
jgi:hypothetical protein